MIKFVKELFKKRKVLVYDMAYMPDGETTESIMEKFNTKNTLFYDSFKEGKNGASVGKLAGNCGAKSPYIIKL